MKESLGLVALFLVVVALLRQNQKLTKAALVQTNPAAATLLSKPRPVMSGWAKRRHKRNPQAEPEQKTVDYAQPGIMVGL